MNVQELIDKLSVMPKHLDVANIEADVIQHVGVVIPTDGGRPYAEILTGDEWDDIKTEREAAEDPKTL